jgi:hypothetical protein
LLYFDIDVIDEIQLKHGCPDVGRPLNADVDVSNVKGSPQTSAVRHAVCRVVQADGMVESRCRRADAFRRRLLDVIFRKDVQNDNLELKKQTKIRADVIVNGFVFLSLTPKGLRVFLLKTASK